MKKKLHAATMTVIVSSMFTFLASPRVEAVLDSASKCEIYRTRVELKFAKCLDLANVLEFRGKAADLAKCSNKYDEGIARDRRKLVGPWSGGGFEEAETASGLGQSATDTAKALQIVAAGRDVADFGLATSDLHAGIDLPAWIDAAIAAAPGPKANDESICDAAEGVWDGDDCSPNLSDYNCSVGAMCSFWALAYPDALAIYTNDYAGDAPGVGDAEFCTTANWNDQRATLLPLWTATSQNPYDYPALLYPGGSYNICQQGTE